jgi:protein TonB
MEANSILKADMLDILFENRNKEYGAYELRKTYNKRIKHAVAIMCMLCLMLLVVNIFAGSKKSSAVPLMVSDTIKLTKIDEQHPEEIKAPLLKPPVQNVATIKDAIPRIMPDKEVRPEDIPPTTDQLEDNVQIGSVTKGGDIGDVVAPPVEQSTGSGEGPKETKEDYDKIFTVVQVEAQFPGGLNAWAKYLESNLRTEVSLEMVHLPESIQLLFLF